MAAASSSTRVPQKPSFFKIILPKTIEDGKITIPKSFVRAYGDSLSSPVLLEDPFDAGWKVELTNHDDNLWLDDGWREFVDHYSIEQGFFLTFKWKGNSQFRVTIFDSSASEIAYPVTIAPCEDDPDYCSSSMVPQSSETETETQVSETESESGVIMPDDLIPPPLKRKRSQSQSRSKRIKSSSSWINSGVPEKPNECPAEGVDGKPLTLEYVQPKVMRKIKKLLKGDEHKAVKEAMGFETENPYFLVIMYPTYINEPKQVCVPLPFAEKYFPGTEGNVTFQFSDGRTWPLKFKIYTELRRCQISSGWRRFVWDNKLQLDDVCMFELIKSDDLTMKVTIFREIAVERNTSIIKREIEEDLSEDIQPSPLVKIEPTELVPDNLASPEALKAARSFKSEHPFFHVVITPAYAQGETMELPKDFYKTHFATSLKTVQIQVGKVSWPVRLASSKGRVRQFSEGWAAFAKGHDLHAGRQFKGNGSERLGS
ncbi:hypothetical protein ACFE04_023330 [Oxalis oulophora]